MKERFGGNAVEAAAATEACRGKVVVMFQSETEVTSLRGQELLVRIVLR